MHCLLDSLVNLSHLYGLVTGRLMNVRATLHFTLRGRLSHSYAAQLELGDITTNAFQLKLALKWPTKHKIAS